MGEFIQAAVGYDSKAQLQASIAEYTAYQTANRTEDQLDFPYTPSQLTGTTEQLSVVPEMAKTIGEMVVPAQRQADSPDTPVKGSARDLRKKQTTLAYQQYLREKRIAEEKTEEQDVVKALELARRNPGTAWQEKAACNETDPEVFFPEGGSKAAAREARKTCFSCVVRSQCLGYALETKQEFGIWGGKTERDRRRILRKQEDAQTIQTQATA